MQNRKRKVTRKGGPRRQHGGLSVPRPKQFMANVRANHTFRWVSTGAATTTVTSDSMRQWLCVASSATTTVLPWEAWRLRRVAVWGQPPALGAAAVEVSVDWKGSNPTDAKRSDTSCGIVPAYVTTRPPKESSARWWYDNGATNTSLFSIVYPIGATIECDVEMLFVDDSAAISGPTTTGASLGRVYGTGINGNGSAAGTGSTTAVGLTQLP